MVKVITLWLYAMAISFVWLGAQNLVESTDVTNQEHSAYSVARLFKEGDLVISYGMGYGFTTPLYYGWSQKNIPESWYISETSHTRDGSFHILTGVAAIDYFFKDYFDIGAEFSLAGNLNSKVGGEGGYYRGDTRILLIFIAFRGLIHYSFSVADLYGGISTGLHITYESFTRSGSTQSQSYQRGLLGWAAKVGSRFKVSEEHGVFVEGSFPMPWLTIGGYYHINNF